MKEEFEATLSIKFDTEQDFISHAEEICDKEWYKEFHNRTIMMSDLDPDIEYFLFGPTLFWYGRGAFIPSGKNRSLLSRTMLAKCRLMAPPEISHLFEKNDEWIFYTYSKIFVGRIQAANKFVNSGSTVNDMSMKKRHNLNQLTYLPRTLGDTPQYFISKTKDL